MTSEAIHTLAEKLLSQDPRPPADLLAAAVDSANQQGFDWLQTLLLVQELERMSGLILCPLMLND